MSTPAQRTAATSTPPVVPAGAPKPVVLALVRYYLPGYKGGGPIRTIENMVAQMSDRYSFLIVCSDRDLGDAGAYPGVALDAWNTVGPARVFYATTAMRTVGALAALMRETPHDLLYLNSFFDPHFTLFALLARRRLGARSAPVLLAPRGEFSRGALGIKRWKKTVYLRLVGLGGIFRGLSWQGSTASESDDILRVLQRLGLCVGNSANLLVAPDLAEQPGDVPRAEPPAGASGPRVLRVCFVARIAPVKNLDYALRVLAQAATPVHFSIYGPQESAPYWEHCDKLIQSMPAHVSVAVHGGIEHAQVRAVIAGYDLFFLPSQSENFGHVFLEAMSAGVPLLVSDQTPWRNLKEQQLGWDISLADPSAFAAALQAAAQLGDPVRERMRLQCKAFARQVADDPAILQSNHALFTNALHFFNTSRTDKP